MSLTGWIDVAQRTRLSGWAAWAARPDSAVELDLCTAATALEPAERFGRVLANGYRPDLDVGNTGYQGRHGFDIDLREYSLPAGSFLLDIVDSERGERLPGGPAFIPAEDFAPVAVPIGLVGVGERPLWRLPADVVACWAARDGTWRAVVPPAVSAVMLCSPVRLAPGDARRLAARLTRFVLDGTPIGLDSDAFLFGFHASEAGGLFRWTDGAATVVLGPRERPVTVEMAFEGLQPASPDPPGRAGWRLSAALRSIPPAYQCVPYVGDRFLAPPLVPLKRRSAVRS